MAHCRVSKTDERWHLQSHGEERHSCLKVDILLETFTDAITRGRYVASVEEKILFHFEKVGALIDVGYIVLEEVTTHLCNPLNWWCLMGEWGEGSFAM